MPSDRLRDLKKSPRELRAYCVENKLDIVDVLDEIEDLLANRTERRRTGRRVKKKTKGKSDSHAPKSAREVIDDVQSEYRKQRFSYGTSTLEEFSSRVEFDLEQNDLETNTSTSFQGFVANRLYESLFVNKYTPGDGKRRRRIRKKVKECLKITKDEDFSKFLWVTFDPESMDKIRGVLSRDYVRENYGFVDGDLVLLRDGEVVKEPSIEGTRSWYDPEKEETRKMLVDHVEKFLLSEIKGRTGVVDGTIRTVRDERKILEDRIGEIREQIVEIGEGRRKLQFFMKGPNYRIDQFVKDVLGGRSRSSKVEGREVSERGTLVGEKNAQHLTITFDLRTYTPSLVGEFFEQYKKFIRSLPKSERGEFESNLNQILKDGILGEHAIQIKNREIGRCDFEIRKIDTRERELVERKKAPVELNYLGLEGPNFTSFFKLHNALSSEGVSLRGVFPENGERAYNLMTSLIEHGEFDGAFDSSEAVRADLDELLLLDFLNHPDVGVVQDTDEESDTSLRVKYKRESLSIDDYHSAIDRLEKESVKKVAGHYDISEEFATIISNRPDYKFDIVFLDYVGRMTPRREKALETLVKRRLKDSAVVATTVNINPWVNPKRESGDAAELNNNFLEIAWDAFTKNGYTPVDMAGREYNTDLANKSNILFQIYPLKKD
ncbi:hypothetical protein CMI45_02710 [Candidatus Pacearchaeota archaeon]|nr:hypothetical protein [Candidatus Pacearchaeota archaeon]|tara:strand:+ start:251 stop:2239 length:1989 start_codon:yes stop_codon:yes gene_type:complete